MSLLPPFCLVFLAGGKGKRMGNSLPKQYLLLQNKPLALYSFETFLKISEISHYVVVCEPAYQNLFRACSAEYGYEYKLHFALPGLLRQDSLFNGIEALKENPLVCIHDAARPFVSSAVIREVVLTAQKYEAAVAGVPVKSTIKICNAKHEVLQTPKRETMWEIQTPQVIRLDLLKQGFVYAHCHHLTVTDDVSLVESLGKLVKVVEGSYFNFKVTTLEDLTFFNYLLTKSCSAINF